MKQNRQPQQAGQRRKLQHKWQPWALSVVAAAALTAVTYSPQAQALTLGQISVQSALGEPLRAEIDLPQITADESASLKAGLASPDTFRSAGLEYHPALAGIQVSLQRRADGREYLRLSSSKPIHEPFLDLMLSAQWSTGRMTRDYTLLLDPPALRQAPAVAVTAPALPAAPASSAVEAPVAPASSATSESTPEATATADTPATTAVETPAAAATPSQESTSKEASELPPAQPETPPPAQTPKAPEKAEDATPIATAAVVAPVKVRPGETAGRIAAAHKPDQVSLDQMLVAMLRANPRAFIDGNVNHVRSGALLKLPTAEQAAAIPAAEARRIIVAQSRHFNETRRQLAASAPAIGPTGDGRQMAGRLTAQVDDKQSTSDAPDKLTISKGSVKGKPPEAALAEAREAKEASNRLAELSRNVNELARLESDATAPAANARTTAADNIKVAPAAALAQDTPVAAAAPETAPPAPAVVAPKPRPVVVAPMEPAPEPGLMDMVTENPLVPAAGAGLLALLAGLGLYRARRRRQASTMDSSFADNDGAPDSFFGASGGRQIDTKEADATGSSSMMYSPSQLDTGGDVDPVAEADVYLAYGRDLQAEEILQEALRNTPTRLAIHAKLAEIYVRRRDVKALEVLAREAHTHSAGIGPEWDQICALGQSVDPSNPLYQPEQPFDGAARGGSPSPSKPAPLSPDFQKTRAPNGAVAPAPAVEPEAPAPRAAAPVKTAAPVAPPVVAPPAPVAPAPAMPDLEMDFSALDLNPPAKPAAKAPAAAALPDAMPVLDFSMPELTPAAAPAPAAAAPAADASMLEFDLGSLTLDLDPTPAAPAMVELGGGGGEDDPLATKLALAQEFHAIGDSDGARSMVEEVVAEASGPLKARAQRFLAELV